MTRSISIDDEVFDALKQRAVPFEDHEPNDVLRRLLLTADASADLPNRSRGGAPSESQPGRARREASSARNTRTSPAPVRGKSPKRRRTPSDALLPEEAYEIPILRVLHEAGGRLPTSEAVAAVGDMVYDQLRSGDREPLEGGKPRWQSRIQFTRLRLVESGLMKKDSPRGVWEISEQGAARLAREAVTA